MTLFDQPQARKTDLSTSKEAAAKAPKYRETVALIWDVLEYWKRPLTDDHIYSDCVKSLAYKGSPQNLRGARLWMVRNGELEKVDELGVSDRGNRAARWYFKS